MNKKKIGNIIKAIREKKGYTQAQLAEMTGISRRVIVHYENAETNPVVENLIIIAEALKVSINELFGLEVNSKPQRSDEDVTFRIMKRVRVIEQLPKRDQDKIFALINELAEKNKEKGKL